MTLPSYWELCLVVVMSFLCCGAWRGIAIRKGAVDLPGARRSHVVPTPRGAGVAMALVLLVASMAMVWFRGAMVFACLGSCLLAALIGAWDDLRPLRASLKLLLQGLVAVPAAMALPLFPDVLPAGLGMFASWFFLVALMNAWNFMDGSNGMVSLQAIIVLLVVVSVGGHALMGLCWLLIAVIVGFLPWNLFSARLFLGDSGSFLLGMGVGIGILAGHRESSWSMLAALGLLSAFFVDTVATLVWRAKHKRPLALAHRDHLYQWAIRSGVSHPAVAFAYAGWTGLVGASLVYLEGGRGLHGGWVALAVPAALGIWLALRYRWHGPLFSESG